jgi:hypothetical protein
MPPQPYYHQNLPYPPPPSRLAEQLYLSSPRNDYPPQRYN